MPSFAFGWMKLLVLVIFVALAIPVYSQGRGSIHSMQHFQEEYGELPREVQAARKKVSKKEKKKKAANEAARIAEMKQGRAAFRGDKDFEKKYGQLPREVVDARLDGRLKAAGKQKMTRKEINAYRKTTLKREKQKAAALDQFPPQRRQRAAGKKKVKFAKTSARMGDDDSLAEEYYYDDANAYVDDRDDAYTYAFDDDLLERFQQESYLRGFRKGYENAKRFK